MKKYKMLEKAMREYSNGTTFKNVYCNDSKISTGIFEFLGETLMVRMNVGWTCTIWDEVNGWAEIVTDKKPEREIINKLLSVKVVNEIELLSMRKFCKENGFYDGDTDWKTWNANFLFFNLSDRSVGVYAHSSHEIISFTDFAKIHNIKILKEIEVPLKGEHVYAKVNKDLIEFKWSNDAVHSIYKMTPYDIEDISHALKTLNNEQP